MGAPKNKIEFLHRAGGAIRFLLSGKKVQNSTGTGTVVEQRFLNALTILHCILVHTGMVRTYSTGTRPTNGVHHADAEHASRLV